MVSDFSFRCRELPGLRPRKVMSTVNKSFEQFEAELNMFRDAAVHSSIFMERNANMPFNDATLENLDRQIDDERSKVVAGGSRDKLDRLTAVRSQYQPQVDVLEDYMKKDENHQLLDQNRVEQLMRRLYNLKYNGSILRNMQKVINAAPNISHREKPHVMRTRPFWTSKKTSQENINEGRCS
ncbi:hypothetical protein BJ170DRAFT_338008 [Xylariales sp. AK1849]|nr:hypothetical protein BJ170DRAFT_338008 [Xylariales sp. AK1849]